MGRRPQCELNATGASIKWTQWTGSAGGLGPVNHCCPPNTFPQLLGNHVTSPLFLPPPTPGDHADPLPPRTDHLSPPPLDSAKTGVWWGREKKPWAEGVNHSPEAGAYGPNP